jgi:hypothetical protein
MAIERSSLDGMSKKRMFLLVPYRPFASGLCCLPSYHPLSAANWPFFTEYAEKKPIEESAEEGIRFPNSDSQYAI